MMSTAGDACPLFQHFSLIDNWCLQQRPAGIYPAQVEQVADRLARAEPQSITLGQAKVPAANYQTRKKKKKKGWWYSSPSPLGLLLPIGQCTGTASRCPSCTEMSRAAIGAAF